MNNFLLKPLALIVAAQSGLILADHSENNESGVLEEVYVTGGAEAIRTLPGSASFIDSEALKAFDSTDLNDVLGQVPGVYIRFEDGYGLRPNIGIRGATSERSQKITLMEDGILITPAPYSAPAAYYIPNVNRMDAVEVFKGPSSIQYGPHTVGGALNLVTRAVPTESEGQLSVTLGNDGYQKYRAFYGNRYELENSNIGFWLDGLRYGADGFKELDGQDTGFVRNDLNAKFLWQTTTAKRPQTLLVKLGYADEDSDETYLGLTDNDFAETPNRRYVSTSEDGFVSEHTQAHIIHSVEWNERLNLTTRAYVNRFDRDWERLNGFFCESDGLDCQTPVQAVLADPERYFYEYGILTGQQDSLRAADEINIVSNDRQYGSQGIEFAAEWLWQTGAIEHTSTFGLRYHEDYVERNHQPFLYNIVDGQLAFSRQTDEPTTLNKSEAEALALYVNHEMQWEKLKLTAGLRFEDIDSTRTNFLEDGEEETGNHSIVIPGVGAFYQVTNELGLLAGINRGFSPSVAGSGAEPEESVNFEYGVRYQNEALTADVIGFYSDYSNLIARCRASEASCEQGEEFNGGEADIYGVEFTSEYSWSLAQGLTVPLSLAYTYTDATFGSSFESSFSQWGNVATGDELPYLPKHQAKFGAGLEANQWSFKLTGSFVSRMREVAEQGRYSNSDFTRSYLLWNAAFRYIPNNQWDFLLAVENIFDKQVIVSRRPLGARPNQPLFVKAGVTYSF